MQRKAQHEQECDVKSFYWDAESKSLWINISKGDKGSDVKNNETSEGTKNEVSNRMSCLFVYELSETGLACKQESLIDLEAKSIVPFGRSAIALTDTNDQSFFARRQDDDKYADFLPLDEGKTVSQLIGFGVSDRVVMVSEESGQDDTARYSSTWIDLCCGVDGQLRPVIREENVSGLDGRIIASPSGDSIAHLWFSSGMPTLYTILPNGEGVTASIIRMNRSNIPKALPRKSGISLSNGGKLFARAGLGAAVIDGRESADYGCVMVDVWDFIKKKKSFSWHSEPMPFLTPNDETESYRRVCFMGSERLAIWTEKGLCKLDLKGQNPSLELLSPRERSAMNCDLLVEIDTNLVAVIWLEFGTPRVAFYSAL